jgi:hypothetical protein
MIDVYKQMSLTESTPTAWIRVSELRKQVMQLVQEYRTPILLGSYYPLDPTYQPPVDALMGREVMRMPDEWSFQPDPKCEGEAQNWNLLTKFDSWKPIDVTKHWDDQGHPALIGDGWYALRTVIPSVDAKHVYMLFGAVDETYKLWINGKYLGESTGDPSVIWDKPQACEITGKFEPGKENLIIIRVHNKAYAGGLWKPIRITATR